MNDNLIDLRNIFLSIGGKEILENVDLQIKRNEIVTLVGQNGGGKTKLLEVIIGLIKSYKGVAKTSGKISYMPQFFTPSKHIPITVKEFCLLTGNFNDTILEDLQIKKLLNHNLAELSGGEKQKVLFAATIMKNADILILDEPEQNLDIESKDLIFKEIDRVTLDKAVLIVSHDPHFVFNKTDRVVCLNKTIHCHGKPRQSNQKEIEMLSKMFSFYQGKHDSNS